MHQKCQIFFSIRGYNDNKQGEKMNKTLKLTLATLLLSTMTLYAGKGKLRVASDHQGAYVYVDGKKKAMIGEGFSSILLEEGEYTIKVAKAVSEQYETYISKRVFVGEDSSVKITLNPNKVQPTKEYALKLKELDRPKLARWKRSGEVVTDTKLGLMWQDNSAAKSTKKKWKSAKNYCKNLSMGGHSDWRSPNYDELLTIVDYDRYDPAIMPSFKNVASSYYWSSSVYGNAEYLWFVRFKDGHTNYEDEMNEHYIRCLRAG
jgi:hypothetical protein